MIKYGKTIVTGFDPLRFPIAVVAIPNHPEYPLHSHAFTEVQIFLKGSATNVVDGRAFHASVGNVFIFHGSHCHEIRDVDDLHLLNILFDPRKIRLPDFVTRAHVPLASLLVQVSSQKRREKEAVPFLNLGQGCLARVEALGYQLRSEIEARKPGHELFCMAYLLELFGLLSRSRFPSSEVHEDHAAAIEKAVLYLSQHYTECVDPDALVKRVGLSRSKFYRLFHQIHGQSPGRYLIQLRNRHAARLLKVSNSNITEIAYEVGFSDSNYFSRSFYQMFGMSPSAFRKSPISLIEENSA